MYTCPSMSSTIAFDYQIVKNNIEVILNLFPTLNKRFKYSVSIGLFIILWVTKLIRKENPKYAVLDKDPIKNKPLPCFGVPSHYLCCRYYLKLIEE